MHNLVDHVELCVWVYNLILHSMTYGAFDKLAKRVVLVVALCLPCVWILLQIDIQRESKILFTPRFHIDNTSQVGFLVDTIGCRIPDLDPFDNSIKKFIYNEDKLVCDKKRLPLIESNLTSLYVNRAALTSYNITDRDDFTCCYKSFWRVEVTGPKYGKDVDGKFKFDDTCTFFKSEVKVDTEYVKVQCYLNSILIYRDYHAFIQIKEDVEERCNATQTKDAVSVLVIGVDAVSRLNLHRQMPETISLIQKNLNVVEMLGYNKIDDNTFPNLVPVLSGLSVDELKSVCWPSSNSIFDKCPFIWQNYSLSGYRTMFSEDSPWMGTFIYVKRGFRKQPTDYYPRIFFKLAEDEIGHDKRLNTKLCIGSRLGIEFLLNYASKFAVTMLNKPSFGFVWGASLSHDYLNLPKIGDKYYVDFFRKLLNLGVFNNTVLVFMSDHGIRWGDIRSTYQGHLEERLPFLFVTYPDWFKRKYPSAVSNLRKNAHKLTTPFDLYETLKDLLNLESLDQVEMKQRSDALYSLETQPRGISLFLPVYQNRTCAKAGIAAHWCTCHQGVTVPTNDSNVKHCVDFLLKFINNLLLSFPQCSALKLHKIIHSRLEKPTAHMSVNTTDAGIQDYTLSVQTVPGDAMFEATVRHNANRQTYSLAGAISRINLYGNQSYCVSNYRMRLYCYCLNQK